MPRTARVLLPYTPHHVVQRGHNRASVFNGHGDYVAYLDTLREWKTKLGVAVHAYCLMTNHVHLVVRPGEDTASIGRLMRRVAGRQTRRVNALKGRSGTLWNGRYRASPIQSERYLLACTRYVELNPVRAKMVRAPEEYEWSSFRQRAGLTVTTWLDYDECYLSLGTDAAARRRAYAEFISCAVDDAEMALIRASVHRNQLTGDGGFVEDVAKRLGRRIELRGPGRPPRPRRADELLA